MAGAIEPMHPLRQVIPAAKRNREQIPLGGTPFPKSSLAGMFNRGGKTSIVEFDDGRPYGGDRP